MGVDAGRSRKDSRSGCSSLWEDRAFVQEEKCSCGALSLVDNLAKGRHGLLSGIGSAMAGE